MPLIQVKVIEGVFSDEQKQQIIEWLEGVGKSPAGW
jgi:phenylpyruvate tautomerase PptA (4-oxalocrotonate tautomerase family)